LVAAEAPDEVARANARAQVAGHDPQQLVARGVAVLVVDLLEAVEIDEQHGPFAGALALRDALLDSAGDRRPVQAARQFVVARAAAQLLAHRDAVAHVDEARNRAADLTALVGQRAEADLAVPDAAVLAAGHGHLDLLVSAVAEQLVDRELDQFAVGGLDAG